MGARTEDLKLPALYRAEEVGEGTRLVLAGGASQGGEVARFDAFASPADIERVARAHDDVRRLRLLENDDEIAKDPQFAGWLAAKIRRARSELWLALQEAGGVSG